MNDTEALMTVFLAGIALMGVVVICATILRIKGK